MIRNKLMPWYIAQARIATVTFITLPMVVATEFMNVWWEVYRGGN